MQRLPPRLKLGPIICALAFFLVFGATAQTELISNGGFESGLSSWTTYSGTGIQATLTTYPHTGSHYAYLTGNSSFGGIYQNVTIPPNASSATLSFWWNVSSDETTTTLIYDDFYISIYDSTGVNQLDTVKALSNLNKGTAGVYQQVSTNLMAYKGQTIRIRLNGQNDPSNITTFRIDDMSLLVTTTNTCTYSINPSSTNVTADAGSGSFSITAGAGCSWSASPSQSWIHTTSGSSGNGTISYTYDANPGGSRSGTITVGGQTFTINQGPMTVTVTAPAGGANWTAGTAQSISWTITGSDTNISYYKIALTTNAFVTTNDLTPSGLFTPSARSFNWNIDPSLNTTQARIRVRALDSGANILAAGTNGSNFTISPGGSGSGWTPLAHTAPGNIQLMLLLSDGTVLCAAPNSSAWYKLTPVNGSYVNGTWSTKHAMNDTRLFYSSALLRDGKLFVAGGEYGSGWGSAEIYDPQSDSWAQASMPAGLLRTDNNPQPPANANTAGFTDSMCKSLPNGNILVAPNHPISANATVIYNPLANTWSSAAATVKYQAEASWVKLPDDSILTVDPSLVQPNGTVTDPGTTSERYVPSLNQWVTDANVPVSLYTMLAGYYGEIGPALLLPNGKALFLGGQGHTAIYTPSGNSSPGTWVAGPDIPAGFVSADSPAAMMANGKILCTVASAPYVSGGNVIFDTQTSFYEYDYSVGAVGSFTQIVSPTGGNVDNVPPYTTTMLNLPDGTILYTHGSAQLYAYQAGGSSVAAGKPTISNISLNPDGSYHLTGTKLNGISEGAAYGDDAQMDSNYPLVRMTNSSSGNVYYGRTYNWSSTSVMTGNNPVSTEFTTPAGAPLGSYSLVVVANGISSDPVSFTISQQYTITASASAGGAVNPSGSFVKIAGDSQQFTATPDPNYAVDQWTVDSTTVLPNPDANHYTLSNIQGNHNVHVTFTYVKSNQTISFGALPNRLFGEPPFTLNATASSGLSVSFTNLSGPASLSGSTLTVTNTGTVSVRASQPGDANYNAAPDVVQSFSVYPRPTLGMNRSAEFVAFSWPTNVPGVSLEFTTNLTPPVAWLPATPPPQIVGGQNTITNGLTNRAAFYRLRK